MDVVVDDFGIETLRVLKHAFHERRALQPFHVTGPVINIGGGHQLATLLNACDHDGIQVGACRINRCSVTGRSGAEDQNPAMFQVTHV